MCLLKQAYTSGSFQSGLLDPFFVFTEGLSLQEKRGVEGDSEKATCTLSHLVKQLVLPYFCSAPEAQEQRAAWL